MLTRFNQELHEKGLLHGPRHVPCRETSDRYTHWKYFYNSHIFYNGSNTELNLQFRQSKVNFMAIHLLGF